MLHHRFYWSLCSIILRLLNYFCCKFHTLSIIHKLKREFVLYTICAHGENSFLFPVYIGGIFCYWLMFVCLFVFFAWGIFISKSCLAQLLQRRVTLRVFDVETHRCIRLDPSVESRYIVDLFLLSHISKCTGWTFPLGAENPLTFSCMQSIRVVFTTKQKLKYTMQW